MSTFTQFNGPFATSGPSTKDLTGLIDAYTNLKATLDRHINDDIDTNNVHRGRDYIDSVKRDIQAAIDAVLARLNTVELNKVDKPAAGHLVNNTELDSYATLDKLADELDKYTSTEGMSEILRYYVKDTEFDALKAIVESTRDSFLEFKNNFNTSTVGNLLVQELNGVLAATEYLLGMLHAKRVIDFTEWQTVLMQFAGTGAIEDTGTNGLYVIGKLSDDWSDDKTPPTLNVYKSARAFIKYENGAPFDAVIDMVVTKHGEASFTGAINAIISKQPGSWNNLRFHLCRCTDYEGKEAIYLCVSADGLAKDNSNYANWYVHACGINFIPLDEKNIKYVQHVDDCITSTAPVKSEQGSSITASNITVGELNLDVIRDSAGNIMLQMQHIIDETGVDHRHLLIGDASISAIQLWKRPTILSIDPDNPEQFVVEDKIATIKDLQSLASVPLGGIIQWPLHEEVYELDDEGNPVIDELTGLPVLKMIKAIEVPEGFLACDGSSVYSVDYSDFSKLMHHENDDEFNLPLYDCAIIKVKVDTDEGGDDYDPERITVLNYNQIVELLKNTSKNLKEEIERSTTADSTHDSVLDEHDRILDEHDRILDSHDQSIDNLNTAIENTANALDAEINRSVAKDNEHNEILNSHDSSITSLSNTADSLNTAIESTAAALDTEITRATQAEAELLERVNNRPTKAQVKAQIQEETDRAIAEEQRIEAKIDDEVTRATAAEEQLEKNKVDKGAIAAPIVVTNPEQLEFNMSQLANIYPGQRAYVSSTNRRYIIANEGTPGPNDIGTVVASIYWRYVGNEPWE